MSWVRRKGAALQEGDGQICIAGPHGPIHCSVIDGAFEWPEEAGAPHNAFEVTDPSPEAREKRRQEQIAALESEAERLGFRLSQLREQGVAAGAPPPTPPAVAAAPAPLPPRPQAAASPVQVGGGNPPIQAPARRNAMVAQPAGGRR